MRGQEGAVIGQLGPALRLDLGDRRGQGHLAELVMVAVRFPVGGAVDQLRPLSRLGEAGHEPGHDPLAPIEGILERDGPRDRAVIEEEGEAPSIRAAPQIRAAGIDPPVHRVPRVGAEAPDTSGLVRGQDREADPRLRQHLERLLIDGRLGQP